MLVTLSTAWCKLIIADILVLSSIPINPWQLQRCFFPRKTKKQITKARSEKKATKVFSLKKASNFHQMRINGETTKSDKKL